jgi:hypothetical protein
LFRFTKLTKDIPNRFDIQKCVFDRAVKYLEALAQLSGDPQYNAAKEPIRDKLHHYDAGDEHTILSDGADERWWRQVEYEGQELKLVMVEESIVRGAL